jgi:hypothetical protein
MMNLSRRDTYVEKVVFIDGLPGCGKTLFSPIVAAMDRVELLTYAYEIENYCALNFLGELSLNTAQAQVRLMADLQLYNLMMGREVNFRPSDLSSVIQDHNPSRYFRRIFEPGDEAIPDAIKHERPILNLTTHQLLAHSDPIWEALGDRCVFVEIIRHPLYMIRQEILNEKNIFGTSRCFDIYFEYKGIELPYYVKGWEEIYINSNPEERVIHYIDNLVKRTEASKERVRDNYNAQIITIPFEEYVLNPEDMTHQISSALETEITKSTRCVMKKQNIPRKRIADGIDTPVYRRCGWVPPKENVSERNELLERRQEISRNISNDVLKILDNLCDHYEKTNWPSL